MFRFHGIIIMLLLYEVAGLIGWHEGPIIEIDHARAAVQSISESLKG